MTYEKHKLEIVLFDNADIFTIGYASDANTDDGSGSGQHSYGGDGPSDM